MNLRDVTQSWLFIIAGYAMFGLTLFTNEYEIGTRVVLFLLGAAANLVGMIIALRAMLRDN